MSTKTVLIGADPEVFIYNEVLSHPVSAHDLVPGTKKDPQKVPLGAIQVDGLAAEFNINPAKTKKEFVKNIKHVQGILLKLVQKKNKNLKLLAQPSISFPSFILKDLPDTVLELGCDPDYSAYTMDVNPKPNSSVNFRTGAGHVHVGFLEKPIDEDTIYSDEHFERCADLVRNLDFVLHPMSKLWDTDTIRNQLYGCKGAFRPKTYGVEYRVLSNAWLKRTELIEYVYSMTKAVSIRWLNGEKVLEMGLSEPMEDLSKFNSWLVSKKFPEYTANEVN